MKRTQTTYRADLPVQLRSYLPGKLPDPAETINSLVYTNDPHSPSPRGRPAISNGASWDALALLADLEIIDARLDRLEARPTEIIQPTITDKGEAIQKLRQIVEALQGRLSFLEQRPQPEAIGSPAPSPPPPTGNIGVGLLGDSITWYMDQAPASSEGLLGFAPTFNFGSPSATTTVMLSQVPALLDLKPKAAMILGGVNDYPLSVPRQTTVDNIVAMVGACMTAGVIPLVQGILPVASTYALYGGAAVMNAEIAARNALIHEALLPLKGGQWIDWGGTLAPGDWLGDSIHLSAAGFAKMAAALGPYVDLYR